MKRKIFLNESQLKNLIKRIILEADDDINITDKSKTTPTTVIFVAGITRDISYKTQVDTLKRAVVGKTVLDFTYQNWNGAVKAIKKYPNSYVVLFSMGGEHANDIALALKESGGNLSNMYIIESPNTDYFKQVQQAIKTGVPSLNVLAGPWRGRGLGTNGGNTSLNTKENGIPYGNHIQALERFTKEKIGGG